MTEVFKNYDAGDGLQGNEFNTGSSFKSESGELFFGGVKGFNRFFPDKLIVDEQKPVVVLTDMLLLNQSVSIDSTQDSLASNHEFTLPQAIQATKTLTLTRKT